MTTKEIKDKILEDVPEIRIQGLLKNRKETLKEFILKFFRDWNEEKETIYIDPEKNPDYLEDFEDWVDEGEIEENKPILEEYKQQCEPGCRRSFGDIYRLCKYYYPRCTVKQITTILWDDCFEELPNFRSSICNMIDKRVFYIGRDNESTSVFNSDTEDEFGMVVQNWRTL